MRRRLTIAIIALVVVTVAVTSLGSYVLIRRAAVSTAERELRGEARAISTTFSDRSGLTKVSFRKELRGRRQRRGLHLGPVRAAVTRRRPSPSRSGPA